MMRASRGTGPLCWAEALRSADATMTIETRIQSNRIIMLRKFYPSCRASISLLIPEMAVKSEWPHRSRCAKFPQKPIQKSPNSGSGATAWLDQPGRYERSLRPGVAKTRRAPSQQWRTATSQLNSMSDPAVESRTPPMRAMHLLKAVLFSGLLAASGLLGGEAPGAEARRPCHRQLELHQCPAAGQSRE